MPSKVRLVHKQFRRRERLHSQPFRRKQKQRRRHRLHRHHLHRRPLLRLPLRHRRRHQSKRAMLRLPRFRRQQSRLWCVDRARTPATRRSSSSICRARAASPPAITCSARGRRTAPRSCSHAIIMSEVLDPKAGVRFQSAKFNWIGTYDAIAHTRRSGTRRRRRPSPISRAATSVVGSFAKAHFTYQWPAMMKRTCSGSTSS